MRRPDIVFAALLLLVACGDDDSGSDAAPPDGSMADTGGDGAVPDGSLPDGSVPDGSLPDGAVPDSSLPDGSAPDGSLPDGDAPDAAPDGGADTIWHPAPGTTWFWQLQGTVRTDRDVDMVDLDLFDTPSATIERLHADGRTVICYFSAGSYEEWRPDARDFPRSALGNNLDDWEGERWVDVRDSGLRAVMRARLDLARERGCDGVEPDNVDGYTNRPGFDFGASGQLDYNRFLATEAHARGLSIGLKNDVDQLRELVEDFDFAVNEQCLEYDECGGYASTFLSAGKAVFSVEYRGGSYCAEANRMRMSTARADLDLDGRRWEPCW